MSDNMEKDFNPQENLPENEIANKEAVSDDEIISEEAPAEEKYVEITVNATVTEEPKKKSALKEIFDWVASIAIAVALVVVLNMFVFVQVVVDGQSMFPTLHNKDRLIATRFLYTPEAGDIVVIEPYLKEGSVKGKLMFGRTLYIKRVIATEGQTIDFKGGQVYIDGKVLSEEYIPEGVPTLEMSTPIPATVPEGHVFVMGDNRQNSKDSRDLSVGMVRYEQVVGKAVFRLLPVKDFGVVK